MSDIVWEDITAEATELAKGLKLFELVSCDGFVLEESMQANQANDRRVDTKATLNQTCHLHYLLQNKIVRHPKDLSKTDLISLYDEMLGYQAQAMTNQPIAHCIYRLPYLYDLSICKQNPFVQALVESVITLGGYCSDLIHNGSSVKQDDFFYSQFSFSSSRKSHDEVVDILLKVEKTLSGKKKGKSEDTALLARIKFRRFMHILCKGLGEKYDRKSQERILQDIDSCAKRLEELAALEEAPPTNGIFNGDIFRTLRSHISPRAAVPVNPKYTLSTFCNLFQQLRLFLTPPSTFTQTLCKLQKLSSMPMNTVSKSYIFCNFIGIEDNNIMSSVQKASLLNNDIVEWSGLKESYVKNEKFRAFIAQVIPVFDNVLYQMQSNRVRWYRACSKSYESLSMAVHFANQIDTVISEGKKEMMVCSWVYYVALGLMIKQLHIGIEIELYYSNQMTYIFYYLEYLLNINDKNSGFFLRKIDKSYVQAFHEKTLDHKKQKKMSPTGRKMFANVMFHKALLYYYKGLVKLLMIFVRYGALKGSLQPAEAHRYKGRFNIFKNVLITKPVAYQTYRKQYDTVTAQQAIPAQLQQAQQSLKQAKNIFQLIPTLQGSDFAADAQFLTKVCIKSALQVMKFKMNKQIAKTLKFARNHPNYPEFMFG